MKIVIVGGGSAGWMTASSLVNAFPEKEIVLVESPNVGTIGVGESTTQYMRQWVDYLGLKDEEWMPQCDATYKMGLKFVGFAEQDFYYPFGLRDESTCNLHTWFMYANEHDVDNADFGRVFYKQQPPMEQNRMPVDFLPVDSGFHFDAIKFANYLKEQYAIPRGVKYIQAHINNVLTAESGIQGLELENGDTITGDIYFDCTGFRSILSGEALGTPWIDFRDKLYNNRTWAVQIPYQDKEKQLVNYTTCTALSSGWVWNVPTWNRMGTGYNYCDKFIAPEEALEEFKQHLGIDTTDLKFRDLEWPTGVREKVWNKNCIAIGLSGGFIEPLESGGLYSVHEFLNAFLDVAEGHENWTGLMRDSFNWKCHHVFKNFANFVEAHYTMSRRNDTPFWKSYTSKDNTLENNLFMQDLFEAQHHDPFDPNAIDGLWFGMTMMLGGYKYQMRNNRKQQFMRGRFPDAKLDPLAIEAIENRIKQAKETQENYPKNLDFYKKIYLTKH